MTITVVFNYNFRKKFKAEDWDLNVDEGMLYLYNSEDMIVGAVKLKGIKYLYVEEVEGE